MTTIDKHGNNHHGAGTPDGGRFAVKRNTAPTEGLTAEPAHPGLDAFTRQREAAASMYLSARNTYFLANRDAARVALREQFPWATTAVFTRAWEDPEDRIVLSQLLGANRELDLEDDDSWERFAETASREQISALDNARRWVQEMGDEVSAYVEPSDEDHEGWHEYDLDLSATFALVDAGGYTVDQLDEQERDDLYFQLSERDGRMPSIVSASEIAYQLTDGDIAQTVPELAAALVAEYGDEKKAAKAIAGSSSWFTFRETIGDHLHEKVNDAISNAGWALLRAES
ncbi:hypothetical protein [Microbacterium gorillae]|uniref:hypothetical protein n=1 Tax=Microbacterium gorillae TaxID=1231063 RepID=UPI003D967E09